MLARLDAADEGTNAEGGLLEAASRTSLHLDAQIAGAIAAVNDRRRGLESLCTNVL